MSQCRIRLSNAGQSAPRTCELCQLGPCKFGETYTNTGPRLSGEPITSGRSCMLCRHHMGVAPSVFCRHPKAMRDDPVSGRKAPATAHSQRIEGKECGPQGDRWEALIIGT